MKLFIIKNKQGKYLQYFDADSDAIGFTDNLTLAMLYDEDEKNIMKNAYSNMEWEFAEITLVEGDLLQKIGELKDYIYSYNDEINHRPQVCNEYIDATCNDILSKMKELKL